jgi:hypothetical protein
MANVILKFSHPLDLVMPRFFKDSKKRNDAGETLYFECCTEQKGEGRCATIKVVPGYLPELVTAPEGWTRSLHEMWETINVFKFIKPASKEYPRVDTISPRTEPKPMSKFTEKELKLKQVLGEGKKKKKKIPEPTWEEKERARRAAFWQEKRATPVESDGWVNPTDYRTVDQAVEQMETDTWECFEAPGDKVKECWKAAKAYCESGYY